MPRTKGTTNATKTVAKKNTVTKRAKKADDAEVSTRVSTSSKAVRRRAVGSSGDASKPVKRTDDAGPKQRAKATATNKGADPTDRLSKGDWLAVGLFICTLVATGYLLGRIAG
jgi:cobalamin biosynthesis Mg chelatase CobN